MSSDAPQFDPAEVKKLEDWFVGLRPMTVDVVGDYAGQELFAIHGDSLVRHCLETGNVDYTDGLQILHAVYEVEKFLDNLQRRKCNFHIVFFRNHQRLCIPQNATASEDSHVLLIRNLVVEHLRKSFVSPAEGASKALVQEFDHPQDEAFARYLSDNAVHFFLCHDGDPSGSEDDQDFIWLRAFIYRLVSQGRDVALMRRIDLVNTKVFLPLVPGTGKRLGPLGIPEPTCPEPCLSPGWMDRVKAAFDGSHSGSGQNAESSLGKMTARDFVFAAVLDQCRESEEGLFKSLELEADGETALLAFAVHIITLRECSLSERSCQRVEACDLTAAKEFLQRFCRLSSEVVYGLGEDSFVDKLPWDMFDLADGRVFFSVFSRLRAGVAIPTRIMKDVEELCEATIDRALPDFKTAIRSLLHKAADGSEPAKSLDWPVEAPPEVLAFRHTILDPFLSDIKLSEAKQHLCGPVADKIFEELTHWHTQKSVAAYKKPAPVLGFYASRRRQRLMADIVSYSASLTNAQGKILEPEVVIVGSQSAKSVVKSANPSKGPAQAESSKAQGKNKGKKPAGGKQAALDAAKQLAQKSAQSKEATLVRVWKDTCARFETKDPLDRYLSGLKYLSELSKDARRALAPEVHLYLCSVLTSQWAKRTDERSRAGGLYIVSLVWYHMKEIAKMPDCTPEVANAIKTTASVLGLPELPFNGTLTASRPLSFKIGATAKIPRVPSDSKHFQLMRAGPYMERTFGSAPDPRVPFEPDMWQRKVLDLIDENKSVFAVAPTSAGKTFISFYAMKKVLQSNDDDVLVYVAPTKALVNQIAAELGAQFSKSFSKGGRCLWSIKTRDYTTNDPLSAQILVTVPHILQIMLLAPSNAERASSWSRRIKRIIFDEVHCIGQAEDGVVWEQLLLMAPCPIIALSATVGNAGAMQDWLASTQRKRGIDLEMVVHDVRYSDLRKFIYEAPDTLEFDGLQTATKLPAPGLDEGDSTKSGFAPVHPVAALIDRKRGTLDDVTLEPRDSLELWTLMDRFQTSEFPLDKSLDPTICLPEVIKKADYVAWESRLKSALHKWMCKPNSPFVAVRAELRKKIDDLAPGLDREGPAATVKDEDGNLVSKTRPHGLFCLLRDLHSKEALPAIVFDYDRSACVRDIRTVFDYLVDAETRFKENSTSWMEDMRAYEKWKSKSVTRAVARSAADREEAKMSKLEKARTEGSEDSSKWTSFDPQAPLDQFSFASTKKLSQSDFQDMVSSLDHEKVQPWLTQALQRGLGVHHSGMNRRYRQAVEILFRRGFLRVVIATGTLALGINMPCKTVIFDRDSLFLTALNYRQASGRAGRRGFDLLGNVVFHNISRDRVFEIMSSRLPDLHGQFALSTTLILRLFTLMSETKNSKFSVDTVQALLSQTRLYLGGPEAAMSIKHHLRFSIDYLRRQYLLSPMGTPLNFAGMVSHLYFTENSAFAFHSLIKGGYFHELCADIDQRPQSIMLELCLVLSHLFCRIPVAMTNKKWIRDTVHRSASIVFLPGLPPSAERLLTRHNEETLDIFRSYVRSYAMENLADTPDRVLPFTRRAAGAEKACSLDTFDRLPATTVRSPFVALSGHGDTFETIHELCSTVRSDVFLEESAVPYVQIAGHDLREPLNAYVYDFFKHGSMEVLVRDNRIKGGDVWFHLKDFHLILMTITTSLRNFVSAESSAPGEGVSDDEDGYDAFGEELDPAFLRKGQGKAVETRRSEAIEDQAPKQVAENWDDDDEGGGGDVEEETVASTSTRSRTGTDTGTGIDTPTSLSSLAHLPSWQHEERGRLTNVVRAFEMFRDEFDVKFKKVWA